MRRPASCSDPIVCAPGPGQQVVDFGHRPAVDELLRMSARWPAGRGHEAFAVSTSEERQAQLTAPDRGRQPAWTASRSRPAFVLCGRSRALAATLEKTPAANPHVAPPA